jgi:hypothetical protein
MAIWTLVPSLFNDTRDPVGPSWKLLAGRTLVPDINPNVGLTLSTNRASTFAEASPILDRTTDDVMLLDPPLGIEPNEPLDD